MNELQTVRKKIHGDFFLEKSYKKGKLFYEALIHKDDYIGINYGYLEDELREDVKKWLEQEFHKLKKNLKKYK